MPGDVPKPCSHSHSCWIRLELASAVLNHISIEFAGALIISVTPPAAIFTASSVPSSWRRYGEDCVPFPCQPLVAVPVTLTSWPFARGESRSTHGELAPGAG